MATEKELLELQDELKPIIQAAIDRGEDLSTPQHMQRFVERVLEQNGYALRGDNWVPSSN
jgi:ArsR family metal-binding transcriptional regulator